MLRLILLLIALVGLTMPAQAQSDVRTDNVRATLIALAPQGTTPGKQVWLGLRLEHRPKWHTYWKNPGDTGLPTTLEWTLPDGVTAGAIDWPTPRRMPIPPLLNYGYEGTVLLPVPVTIGPDYAGGPMPVRLTANWLVCEIQCIPESGSFAITIPEAGDASHQRAFDAAFAARPTTIAGAEGAMRIAAGRLLVSVTGLPESGRGKAIDFFPEQAALIDHAAPIEQAWREGVWSASIPLQQAHDPAEPILPAVLHIDGATPGSVRILLQPDPNLAFTPAARAAGDSSGGGFLALIMLALLGGLILNLMPCVFPVLSLKLLSLARHAGERGRIAQSGMAYSTGVILSFLALAGVMLALRAGGEQIGWGFQLQSPAFVAALAILFFVIGLNLAGMFEIGMAAPGKLAALRLSHPVADSFLTGILAVAVASPCTAPFMAASIGAAATLPAAQALALFAALGLGMALPFLLVGFIPSLASRLPRPGSWMATFRTLMAFPMFAAAVWLIWVLGRMTGADGVAAILFLMVAIAFAIWVWRAAAAPRPAPRLARAAALMILGGLAWQVRPALSTVASVEASAADGTWQRWSEAGVTAAIAAGRPVFVDFTAAWCITCQLNKRAVLRTEAVMNAFARCDVALMSADWTTQDPAITRALAGFGRNGVPVYALYSPGVPTPRLLGEVLSKREVTGAIAALPGCDGKPA